jgi:site-specific recombinase XerD
MLLRDAIERYLRYIRFELGHSKSTCKGYRAYLLAYDRYAAVSSPDPTLDEFNESSVRDYFYSVTERNLRPRTLHTVMIPLRSFGAYLLKQGLKPTNPALSVDLPSKGAARRREASESECMALLAAIERQRNRNRVVLQRAVLSVLIYVGLRRDELCNLLTEDIDLQEGRILVREGKGGRGRRLPLCEPAKVAIQQYADIRPQATHSYFFCSGRNRRLHWNGMYSLFDDAKALAGFADRPHIVPHGMRHACASRLLRHGASLHEVMTWLGHANIQTTQLYLHTSEEQLADIGHLAEIRTEMPPGEQSSKKAITPRGKRHRISFK